MRADQLDCGLNVTSGVYRMDGGGGGSMGVIKRESEIIVSRERMEKGQLSSQSDNGPNTVYH